MFFATFSVAILVPPKAQTAKMFSLVYPKMALTNCLPLKWNLLIMMLPFVATLLLTEVSLESSRRELFWLAWCVPFLLNGISGSPHPSYELTVGARALRGNAIITVVVMF